MGIEAVLDKHRWVRHHFDLLDKAVTEYVDPENIWFVPKRYNETKTIAWGNFESRIGDEAALIVISHMFGDVLQTANSCLDYLICELFRWHNPGEEAKPSHKFPIVTSRGAFNKEIGSDALWGIPFEAVAIVESLQPYDGRTDPLPAQLMALRTLTNTHKHRRLHISVLTANPAPSDLSALFEQDGEVFARAKDLPKAVHFKTEIGPFPVTEDGKVNVKSKYAAVVVLEESEFRGRLITLVAEEFCLAVTEACKRFTPFFAPHIQLPGGM
jgi:hypothetical protein